MKTEEEIIADFIKSHKIAVLSTVTHDALPESAVVGIFPKPKLELVFGTFKTSRKYQNLKTNPRVSLVIGWEGGKTVQYEGEAKELTGSALQNFRKAHLAQMTSAAKYFSEKEAALFKIIPKWVRYSDSSKDPFEQIELKF